MTTMWYSDIHESLEKEIKNLMYKNNQIITVVPIKYELTNTESKLIQAIIVYK